MWKLDDNNVTETTLDSIFRNRSNSETPYMLIYILSDYVLDYLKMDQKSPNLDMVDQIAKETENFFSQKVKESEQQTAEKLHYEQNQKIKKEIRKKLEPTGDQFYWMQNG